MTSLPESDLCACGCGRSRGPAYRGWSYACYFRWYRAGAVEGEEPPPARTNRERAKDRREEVLWLVNRCGESVEHAAERVGVSADTAKRYVNPPRPEATCAVRTCEETAVYHGRCDAHRNAQAVYEEARAAGMPRAAAAFHVGVHRSTTYVWEPGRPGIGRPRKKAAADSAAFTTDASAPTSRLEVA